MSHVLRRMWAGLLGGIARGEQPAFSQNRSPAFTCVHGAGTMPKGHGEKLPRKWELALAGLLTQGTVTQAAAACGVSESTLRRWLRDAAFMDAYREARRAAVETAIGQVQRVAAAAIATLERALTCGRTADEIRAAAIILAQAVDGVKLIDHETRLAELESRLLAKGKK
jgi:transposase-like protein